MTNRDFILFALLCNIAMQVATTPVGLYANAAMTFVFALLARVSPSPK